MFGISPILTHTHPISVHGQQYKIAALNSKHYISFAHTPRPRLQSRTASTILQQPRGRARGRMEAAVDPLSPQDSSKEPTPVSSKTSSKGSSSVGYRCARRTSRFVHVCKSYNIARALRALPSSFLVLSRRFRFRKPLLQLPHIATAVTSKGLRKYVVLYQGSTM